MKKSIISLEIRGDLKPEELFKIIKTKSTKINELISTKVVSFKNRENFFAYYSDKKANDLLYILDKLNNIDFSEKENNIKTDLIIEKYISNLINVILSVKVIVKIQKILGKILNSSKKNLSKLKLENQIQNQNQQKLLSLIDKILNNLKIKKCKKFLNVPMLRKQFSTRENINNNFFARFSIDNASTKNNDELISTPRFKPKEESIKSKLSIYQNEQISSKLINPFSDKESVMTLSKMNFDNESKKQIKNENQKDIIKNSTDLFNILSFKLENINEEKKSSLSTSNLNKINKYQKLLEMTASLYKRGVVNSEEKIKLKQMVISKPEKLENFYCNVYKKSNLNNDILKIEIEKIIEMNDNL